MNSGNPSIHLPNSPFWGNNYPKAIIFDKKELISTGRFLVFFLFL
jgi:hypothetical protein